jgi:hypothetical protein
VDYEILLLTFDYKGSVVGFSIERDVPASFPLTRAKGETNMSVTKRLLSAALLGSIALLLLLVLLPSRVVQGRSALPEQEVTPHEHTANPANIIDGSIHPEMIQDQEAFRLFFLAAATGTNPLPEEKERQRAVLAPVRLSDDELAISSAVLANYKEQYEEAVQKYNDAVASARSPEQLPDGKQLVAALDALAMAAKAKLESSISSESNLRLYGYVKSEKSKMQVSAQ